MADKEIDFEALFKAELEKAEKKKKSAAKKSKKPRKPKVAHMMKGELDAIERTFADRPTEKAKVLTAYCKNRRMRPKSVPVHQEGTSAKAYHKRLRLKQKQQVHEEDL